MHWCVGARVQRRYVRPRGRRSAGERDEILQRDGDAVERSAIPARLDFAGCGPGVCDGTVGQHRDGPVRLGTGDPPVALPRHPLEAQGIISRM